MRPDLAEQLLRAELEKADLAKIVDLTGCGFGSLMFERPALARELLLRIADEKPDQSKDLRTKLIWNARPQSRSITNGRIDPEFLWARERATELAEAHRDDPVLREFYLEIIRHEDREADFHRMRHLQELAG